MIIIAIKSKVIFNKKTNYLYCCVLLFCDHMGLPRQEYWSELPVLSLGDLPPGTLPDPAIELTSPALAARYSTKVCSQIILIHINAALL